MGKKSKDKRDIYYRKAKEQGWRARSAFKLIQLADKFNLFDGVTKAVDLCAAPGSWSQVLSRKLYMCEEIDAEGIVTIASNGIAPPPEMWNRDAKIIAVDLQPMSPLPGVIQLQGDITQFSTAQNIITKFNGDQADLVVCDGAPDVSGLHDMDVYVQSQLLLGALHIACNVLRRGGNFVAKMFRAKQNHLLIYQLKTIFQEVSFHKPTSSRNSSTEAFVVALNYRPPKGFNPTLLTNYLGIGKDNFDGLTGINKFIIPFIVSGDLSGYDADATYPLYQDDEPEYEYRYTEPVQPPLRVGYLDNSPDPEDLPMELPELTPQHIKEFNLPYKRHRDYVIEQFKMLMQDHSYDVAIASDVPQVKVEKVLPAINNEDFNRVQLSITLPEYTIEGDGILISEEIPHPQRCCEQMKPTFLKLYDYTDDAPEDLKRVCQYYEQLNKYFNEATGEENNILNVNANTLEQYKNDISTFYLPCSCGKCE
ncbi:PREDICTED: putative tRNA (cytidine(32)/guanosine(34)-2'-O)-methyltransferase [Nicrophorus vespilloides]|uniref:Putative tRNA (cytidine(32)/guanosine(34)-2'-O)-methyltransferase n=1 Tax=Nicrophorus vespilloides TaxID=110193 RepID=A0ABM1MD78_NICVS|nr:PREDICTED: putative tRNA (cytidine(32)/guanosine(34)-2'-O)-methyltransferase [Nicrophorus vespilloides]